MLAGTPAGVLLSTDRGLTWQIRIAGLTATSIDQMSIDHQEPARLYAALYSGTFKTADQGRLWLRLGFAVQPLVVDPADPDIVYAGAASGIIKSTDGGRHWAEALSSSCLTFRRIAREPAIVYAGTNGLGVLRLDQSGN